MSDKNNDLIKFGMTSFAAAIGFLGLFYLLFYEYRPGADYGWLNGLFVLFGAERETEKPAINLSPEERGFVFNGKAYDCRPSKTPTDFIVDGKPYVCRRASALCTFSTAFSVDTLYPTPLQTIEGVVSENNKKGLVIQTSRNVYAPDEKGQSHLFLPKGTELSCSFSERKIEDGQTVYFWIDGPLQPGTTKRPINIVGGSFLPSRPSACGVPGADSVSLDGYKVWGRNESPEPIPFPSHIRSDGTFIHVDFINPDFLPGTYLVEKGTDIPVNTHFAGTTLTIEDMAPFFVLKSGPAFLCFKHEGGV